MSTHSDAQGLVHEHWGADSIGTRHPVLDRYEPLDAWEDRPAAFILRGGGFRGGNRRNDNSTGFARYFAERGVVAVSIDYRISDHHGTVPQTWADYVNTLELSEEDRDQAMAMYPVALDAKAALRWLHTQAEIDSIETDFMMTIGGSLASSSPSCSGNCSR